MPGIQLSPYEKDILGEIGTMCVGNATTALARILGKRIDLSLPGVAVINIDQLHSYLHVDPEETILGIHMHIFGGAKGNAIMVFPRRDAFRMIDVLIGPVDEELGSFTEVGISAIKEVGNIVVNSYLSALSAFTGISAFPSTVTLSSGATRSIIKLAFSGMDGTGAPEEAILVEAVFKENQRNVGGSFFILFDALSIQAILKKAKGMVKD